VKPTDGGLQPARPFPVEPDELLARLHRVAPKAPTVREALERLRDLEDEADGVSPGLGSALRSARLAYLSALDKERHGRASPPDPRFDRAVRDAAKFCETWATAAIEKRLRQKGFRASTERVCAAVRRLRPKK